MFGVEFSLSFQFAWIPKSLHNWIFVNQLTRINSESTEKHVFNYQIVDMHDDYIRMMRRAVYISITDVN